ncbi:MAG: leucine-rich repeat protein [Bacteroidaceae bacterium]|nr:leucine-rich repeat protein [Bacteroidaceae bacterium]
MKKLFSFIFAALLPVVASAFGEIVIGYNAYVDGIFYNLSGDEAEVTFQEYDEYNAVYISNYTGNIVLPASITYNGKTYRVTGIRSYAFADCKNLLSVTIPESVTSFGESAFYDCSSLVSATIPGNVKSISPDTFLNCRSLTSVTLGDGVANIDIGAFRNCSSLTSVNIPKSVTTIGGSAFEGCTALTDVTIPGSVTSIGNGAFKGCSSLTSLTIEDGVKIIGGGAFYGCSIASVTLPASVTSIGTGAFSQCSSLTDVTFPETVTHVGAEAFNGTPWFDNQPDGLVYIGKVAYRYKGGMPEGTEISIEDGTVQISGYAFNDCMGLVSITIPESMKCIDTYAFYGCRNLASITLPESVTTIGSYAFCGCRSLTSINIPNGVTDISDSVFKVCTSLTSVIIPDGVKSIGDHAFGDCINLTSVTLPENLTSIGRWTFIGCTGLTSIVIPNKVTSIGFAAFSMCSGLKTVTISSGIKQIDRSAFNACSSLTDVYCLAENIPQTANNAFKDSPIAVATLHVPEGSVEKYQKSSPWSSFGNIKAIEQPVTFTAGQVATIILPTEPDASKGMYFRLDRWEDGKIAFEQELQPKARTPYIIVPNEDFSIDPSTLDLTGLRPDTATIEGVYFIGWYVENKDYGLKESTLDFILDTTPDCYYNQEGLSSIHVGPLRACFSILWRLCKNWEWKKLEYILYSADGTKVITEEPVVFTAGQMATIILPTTPDAEKGWYYRLDRCEDGQIIFEQELQPQAHIPYIIIPNKNFSIDTSTLDLAGLSNDTVSIKSVSFIGSYVSKVLENREDYYIDIIDSTSDCLKAELGTEKSVVGALRAYLQVSWDDPYNPGGTKGPQEKLEIVLKDDPNGIDPPTPFRGSNGKCFDLQGRRLIKGAGGSGIYIIDGKKILVK